MMHNLNFKILIHILANTRMYIETAVCCMEDFILVPIQYLK